MLTLCAVAERIAILGSSRGIGFSIAKNLESETKLLLVSRKWDETVFPKAQKLKADLTKDADLPTLLNALEDFAPTRIFYVAGGGPFGEYSSKSFKDHLWALQLNLLTPARILHWSIKSRAKQIVFFGSAIAEEADPFSSSYSAAKHGLVGLVESVRQEKPPIDVRLYSPGYTATELLPKSAQEKFSSELLSPDAVAQDFLKWAFSESQEHHRVFRLARRQ